MADLSQYSDEELLRAAGLAKPAANADDIAKVPTAELLKAAGISGPADVAAARQAAAEEAPGLLTRALRAYDAYGGGASTRAAVGALQEGQSLGDALSRAAAVYGEDPTKDTVYGKRAPTGREQAIKAGAPVTSLIDYVREKTGIPREIVAQALPVVGNIDAADAYGLVLDAVQDPVPLAGPLIRGALKGGAGIAKAVTGPAARAVGETVAESTAGKTTAKVAEGVKGLIDTHINPKRADDWAELEAIAAKNGIDPAKLPESVEFGTGSYIDTLGRKVREGTLGKASQKLFAASRDEVQAAAKNLAAKVGGGQVLDPVEAGVKLRESYDEAYRQFFDTIEVSYDTVIKDYPGLKLSPDAAKKLDSALLGVERFAKGRAERGVTQTFRAQAEGLINSVEAIRKSNGSVKQTVEALRDIGEAAFTAQNSLAAVPPDVAKLRKLYGDITEALHTTIKQDVKGGEEISQSLREANAKMTEWFGEKSVIAKTLGDKNLAPEKVFERLVMNGDTKKIEALNFILGAERMREIKGAALGEILRSNQYKDKLINFNAVRNDVRDKQFVLGKLLAPDELKDFDDLVRLGDRFGDPRLSTSGTGASNEMGKGVVKASADASGNIATLEAVKARARKGAAQAPIPESVPIPTEAAAPAVEPVRSLGPSDYVKKARKPAQIGGAQSTSGQVEKDKEKKRGK